MRSDRCIHEINKAKVCFSQQDHLTKEHFIELIGKRVKDCEAWERKLRSEGKLKDAERMRRTKEQMLRSLKRLECL